MAKSLYINSPDIPNEVIKELPKNQKSIMDGRGITCFFGQVMLKRQQQVPGRRAAISEQVAAALKALERQAVEAGKRKTTVI